MPRRLEGTLDRSTEIPKPQARRSQRAVHSAKKMHGQVTPPDRPLPPGEGWGEGLPATSESSISSRPLSDGCRLSAHPLGSRRQKRSPGVRVHFCLLPSAFCLLTSLGDRIRRLDVAPSLSRDGGSAALACAPLCRSDGVGGQSRAHPAAVRLLREGAADAPRICARPPAAPH